MIAMAKKMQWNVFTKYFIFVFIYWTILYQHSYATLSFE